MFLIHGLLAGIIATALFDIYQIALNYAYGINKTRWDLVGRYFIGLKNNKYFREDLTNDASEKYELIYGYLKLSVELKKNKSLHGESFNFGPIV